MLHSILTASCSSATCWRRSSTWAHLLQGSLLSVPNLGERSRQFWGVKSEVCTSASPFSSSIWVEAVVTSGLDGAEPSARAAAFAPHCDLRIRQHECQQMSQMQMSQNGAQLLGCRDLKPLHLARRMSLLWREALPCTAPMQTATPWPGWCTTPWTQHPWSLPLPRTAFCGSWGCYC